MLLSEKNIKTVEACRFCWMCRHVCPIGNVTGQERNNARARALSVFAVHKGTEQLADIVDNLYECALCGACTKECVTGWDPLEFTKAARLEAAIEGVTPEYILKLIDNIEAYGNPYGISSISSNLQKVINRSSGDNRNILFLGVDARYRSPDSAIAAIKLLSRAGVRFSVLADEPDSGYMMETLTGKSDETVAIMKKAAKVLDCDTIIVYDPHDAKVFLREYKEWGIDIKARRIITFTAYINELLATGKLMLKKMNAIVTYQDPAVLARDLEETAEARNVLSACADLKNMMLSGKDVFWAGNLLMDTYMSDVMRMTSEVSWENAKATGAEILVTACPSEYEILRRTKPEDMKLLRFEDIVEGGMDQ